MSESGSQQCTYSCDTPFEIGGRLCHACQLLPITPQGRKCNRMVARSAVMQTLLSKAAAVADTDASVILRGESGCGKEVVARALHANSKRRLKPFVAVNCAAIPSDLLESELFGHARGAFTGAMVARRGLFESADGGTLLLDEIAEMPLPLQAKLLRALQDGEIRRVGESKPVHVDVRILCATHQDLLRCVRDRTFREDLYFRLKVFTLTVPPLRERVPDIEPLAEMFREQNDHHAGITARALAALKKYPWPGNVRELMHAVKHGAVMSKGGKIDLNDLPEEVLQPHQALTPQRDDELTTLIEAERRHVLRVLEACGGQQQDAARVLGIGRTTLWRKLKGYGLDSDP